MPLPTAEHEGYVECDGARIWYAMYGAGAPVILLHGGLGHGGNWGYQVAALVANGHRAMVIDSRGHGRSTRDARPYTYELMAEDVLAVMDALQLERSGFGWVERRGLHRAGACFAGSFAGGGRVFFFACNMDPSGVKPFEMGVSPILDRCFGRHAKRITRSCRLRLMTSQEEFVDAVGLMQRTEPNYSAADLAAIRVPVAIVQSERDEFIRREHAEYLARTIPNAELVGLEGVSHFAPLQRP